jgi:hypothetical protein
VAILGRVVRDHFRKYPLIIYIIIYSPLYALALHTSWRSLLNFFTDNIQGFANRSTALPDANLGTGVPGFDSGET